VQSIPEDFLGPESGGGLLAVSPSKPFLGLAFGGILEELMLAESQETQGENV